MIIDIDRHEPFRLDASFLDDYRARPVRWGFGPLSWVAYARSYSRDGEEWWQTCRRVIEGTFTVQRIHCLSLGLRWDPAKGKRFAREAFERMFCFKWTPPGRGIWIMGTRFMYERGGAALNNCGFVSTRDLDTGFSEPFLWMFRMSLLGVGVGFDTRGKGKLVVRRPSISEPPHCIADSREGWNAALKRLLDAYAGTASFPSRWDYSLIRERGVPLKSFGGQASGPEPLRRMLDGLRDLYAGAVGAKVDARLITDTMNMIARCVVSGGSRRSAQVALGDADDVQFLDLKADRAKVLEYRWASNNSVFARAGMDYAATAARTAENGEPGYFWLDNARAFGRMQGAPDWRDRAGEGTNPCLEQTLWDRELCCLVETYPAHHDSLDDYFETLRVAYLYAKTVTLIPTEDARTNAVMMQNRRIGCSMTGIVQAIARLGESKFFLWCDQAYAHIQRLDEEYSDWLRVPRSIKTTSVKPSGTVSLLAGATPGVHWGYAAYYIRRIRVADSHPLVDMCRRAGYPVEPDAYSDQTLVISFPVHMPNLDRGWKDVPLREKVDLAAEMQRHWSDNQVSCTATFDPEREAGEIPRILESYEDRLKAISFLPVRAHGYAQPPYEEITARQYEEMTAKIKPFDGALSHEHEMEARFCEGEACETPQPPDPCPSA